MTYEFLNYDQAIESVMRIENTITKALVSRLLRQVELQCLSGEYPRENFDLLFMVKAAEKSFSAHQWLRRILDGESADWPQD